MGNETLEAVDRFISEQAIDRDARGWKLSLPKPPLLPFEQGARYFWDIETNHGTISVRLLPEAAPMHVSSTVYLSRLGFYDDLVFHRVIPEFMAQGGCPRGLGTGGPGYQYDGEFDAGVKHDRPGLLSMANAGPGTDGSQFFLTFVPTPWLDGAHTVFGEVVEGMDCLQELEKRGSRQGSPTEALEMRRTSIRVDA